MKKKTKKNILNAVMVVAIVAVLAAGLAMIGTLKGWFGEEETVTVVSESGEEKTIEIAAENIIGSANIQRKGVAYKLENGNKLRDGDILETQNGSSMDIVFGENRISLDENCQIGIGISENGEITAKLMNGGIFADIPEMLKLSVMDREIDAKNCVFSASAPYGSANIYVFENELNSGTDKVSAGEGITILSDTTETEALSIQQLGAFDLGKISAIGTAKNLCFTAEDVKKLNDEREAERQEALQAQFLEEQAAEDIEEQRKENEKNLTIVNGKKPDKNETDETDDELTCTITIRCDTILDNMGKLAEGKNKYVPANGCILATSRLTFEEGETAFDILNRACKLAGIQLEYSWTPIYDSYYIEGINHLYEFDCGELSGWMYKVNGWYPNYGCSAYTVKDGDAFVWAYTCDRNDNVGGNMR